MYNVYVCVCATSFYFIVLFKIYIYLNIILSIKYLMRVNVIDQSDQ